MIRAAALPPHGSLPHRHPQPTLRAAASMRVLQQKRNAQQLPEARPFSRVPETRPAIAHPVRFGHDFSRIPAHDRYEQEADRVAEKVMGGCSCSGTCAGCVSRVGGHSERLVPPIVHEVLSTSGWALDPPARIFMESRLGHDFSAVRVHSDATAALSARAVGAHAYTVGHHVVFDAGRYAPSTADGRRLLAHELTHTIQQQRGLSLQRQQAPDLQLPLGSPEEATTRSSSTAQDTTPFDVLSWESDTCCTNQGFLDPDATKTPPRRRRRRGEQQAAESPAKEPCCNTFPSFVEAETIRLGYDGAASCNPNYKRRIATVTPYGPGGRPDRSRTVTVVCMDTRAREPKQKDDESDKEFARRRLLHPTTIELSVKAAAKFGKPPLKEIGEVVYGGAFSGTCSNNIKCDPYPKESECLPSGCKKAPPAAKSKSEDGTPRSR
jgi:hypothetical protein